MVDVLSLLTGIGDGVTQTVCNNTDILAAVANESCSLAGTDMLRVGLVFPFLLYASYTDIKRRQVDNWVWITPLIVGILCLAYDAAQGDATVILVGSLVNILVLSTIAYIAYILKVFYGADFKALATLSVAFPVSIQLGYLPFHELATTVQLSELISDLTLNNIFLYMSTELVAYTLISNLAAFSLLYLLSTGLKNVMNGEFALSQPLRSLTTRQKPLAEMPSETGHVVSPTESDNPAVRGYQFIRNGLDGINTQFFRDYLDWHETESSDTSLGSIETFYFQKFLSQSDKWATEQMEEDVAQLEETIERETVMITPAIPFIVPITAAMATTAFVGNIIYVATIGVSMLF